MAGVHQSTMKFLNITTEISSAIGTTVKGPKLYTLCVFTWTPPVELSIIKALKIYIFPLMFLIGFSANMMSVAILKRSGLKKPTNVLLLGMVIADSMVLLQGINFAELLSCLGPNYEYPKYCGWQYGVLVNYFLLACDILTYFFVEYGIRVNTTIPILITLERFLAVYMPMTFKKIVTTKSAMISVIAAYVVWLPWPVFYLSMFRYFIQLEKIMLFAIGFQRDNQLEIYTLLNYNVVPFFSTWMPIFFIGIGCILISIKVKVTLSRRKQMTSKQDSATWSARTTRTLLTTCLFLFMSTIISFFLDYFNNSIDDGYYYFEEECATLNYMLNASSNFFVYIATNRNFAKIFKDIICRKKRRQQIY
ncbi:G-protein coupled receptor [Biomphalaria pfeifferi]|uniref:G-protein coupled receptor n=1 Tax=Biomphalaria pfeifferi TaxID=112525 RepID=A0AAD8C0Z6_BIOPF|nr:G-protein coupled receptor [Biomphalaria pfeifferi]